MVENGKNDEGRFANEVSLVSKSAKISQFVFESEGDVRVDGIIANGSIKTQGKVIIGVDGQFDGDIVAARVDVSGKVSGRLEVADLTTLFEGAEFTGELLTGRLSIDPEANFNGTCKMLQLSERERLMSSLAKLDDGKSQNPEAIAKLKSMGGIPSLLY